MECVQNFSTGVNFYWKYRWTQQLLSTGKPYNTVTDWYNICREVCGAIVSHRVRGKMVGTEDNPIQIDEARFARRRKYKRGRMLNGDQALLSEDSDAVVQNNVRNHGART